MEDSKIQNIRVIDYNAALQLIQGLEARDFSYKGIHKSFLVISDWTEKYISNRALPNKEQLMRDVNLEEEQADKLIHELAFKHNPPLVKKIISIEYDPTKNTKSPFLSKILTRNIVYARPTNMDAGSAQRYINGMNEHSVASITSGFKNKRNRFTGKAFKDFLFSKIEANKIHETYASFDLNDLFKCNYDITREQKEASQEYHLKPVLQKLVDQKVLIAFTNDKTPNAQNKRIFLYNIKDEIIERIEIYVEYMKAHIIPGMQKLGIVSDFSEEEYKEFGHLAADLLRYVDDAYADQKTLLEELVILSNFYENYHEDLKKGELKEKIDEILKLLINAGKLIDVNNIRINGKSLDKEMIPNIIAHESILYAEYSDAKDNYFEFILHKDSLNQAVKMAKKEFQITGNDTYLRVLERMNAKNLLSNEDKKELERLEQESLFKYLPFLVRMWRTIFGNISLKPEEIKMLKKEQEEGQKKRIMESKMKVIQKEKTRIAEERMKKENKKDENVTQKFADALKTDPQSAAPPADPDATVFGDMNEEEAKELLKGILKILDSAWEEGIFPDREYLVKELGANISEEEVIGFLKKFANKEVLSFKIKTKLEKYNWPILISKQYIKRRGGVLLDKAKKATDEQRKAKMPNQEKYDVYTSLEDFLERLINKKKK